MKSERVILYTILLIAIITAGILGYCSLQSNRYIKFGPDNMFIWDNWKEEPVFVGDENSVARNTYDSIYRNIKT